MVLRVVQGGVKRLKTMRLRLCIAAITLLGVESWAPFGRVGSPVGARPTAVDASYSTSRRAMVVRRADAGGDEKATPNKKKQKQKQKRKPKQKPHNDVKKAEVDAYVDKVKAEVDAIAKARVDAETAAEAEGEAAAAEEDRREDIHAVRKKKRGQPSDWWESPFPLNLEGSGNGLPEHEWVGKGGTGTKRRSIESKGSSDEQKSEVPTSAVAPASKSVGRAPAQWWEGPAAPSRDGFSSGGVFAGQPKSSYDGMWRSPRTKPAPLTSTPGATPASKPTQTSEEPKATRESESEWWQGAYAATRAAQAFSPTVKRQRVATGKPRQDDGEGKGVLQGQLEEPGECGFTTPTNSIIHHPSARPPSTRSMHAWEAILDSD